MRKYKISIIMPNYNGGKYIKEAIECFLAQVYQEKELVIVDGRSTDDSHKIIRSFAEKNKNIIWVREKDSGLSNAFNIGVTNSTGDFVGFSGSDDRLWPNILATINDHANKKVFDAIYFDSYNFFPKINERRLRKCPDVPFTLKNLLHHGPIVGGQDIFFKRDIYLKHKWDENNKFSMDYEFLLRISKENYKYLHAPEIATINIIENNISTDKNGYQKKEVDQLFKRYAGWDERWYRFAKEVKKKIRKILVALHLKKPIKPLW